MTKLDGHALVAQTLKNLGVTHVYCVAGTPVRETFSKCAELGIRPIGVRHQQAGVLMSVAQNYVSGQITGVALLSAGPAITNAATGILVAKDNCWPLVVLGGRRPLSMRGMGSFQDLDAVPIFQSITKWSAVVEKTSQISSYIEEAFQVAMSGRPGPVYLDLPEDVLTATSQASFFRTRSSSNMPQLDEKKIEEAADFLLGAKRPAIILGKGVRWSEPFAELRALADEFEIPFMTSPMGRGYLPDDHPFCFNDARSALQRRADVILLLGARLDWTFRFGGEFARDVKLIQIDIEKTEIAVNRIHTIGIVGDVKAVLQKILTRLRYKRSAVPDRDLAAWYACLDGQRCVQREKFDALMRDDTLPMSPYRMLKEIRDCLPRDAISVLDGNVFMAAGQQVLPSYLPASRFTSTNNGCLGTGIPFGIGAKLCHPDRLVIAMCGDTAFSFSAMELETAVRHRIPVIVVVVNNEGNTGGTLERIYFPDHFERVTMFQPAIHYEIIMHAFGGHAEHVERPEQLQPALVRAIASGKASCINVRVDPYASYPHD